MRIAALQEFRRALAAVVPKWGERKHHVSTEVLRGEFCDLIERLPQTPSGLLLLKKRVRTRPLPARGCRFVQKLKLEKFMDKSKALRWAASLLLLSLPSLILCTSRLLAVAFGQRLCRVINV